MDIGDGKLILDGLRFLYDVVKGASSLKPTDRKKIVAEATKIIQEASLADLDKFISEPRRQEIDAAMRRAAGSSLTKRGAATKKRVPRRTTKPSSPRKRR